MPAKLDKHILTMRDAEIFHKHEVEKKSMDQVAKETGVSRDTIKRTKKKLAYRELVLSGLEYHKFGVLEYTKKLVDLTNAKKVINCGQGVTETCEDNVVQLNAIKKIGDIFGDNAPKEIDIASGLAGSSDAELYEELEIACKEAGLDAGK